MGTHQQDISPVSVVGELNYLLASWCPGLLDADLNTSLTRVLRERFSREQSRCELES